MQPSFNYQDHRNLPYIKFGYDGGRYLYKKWVIDKHGNRVAYKCRKSQNPDLQSTYFVNQDNSEVLRFIRLDIDYDKSCHEFKTENVLSWELIQEKLKQYPQFFEAIEYVTRSTSGKGLHILFGIAPLPLDERTNGAQISARQLQFQLIQILNELGIGADPAALGLKQDFCTYKNKNNLIYHNEILTKRIEKEAKKPNYLMIDGAEVSNKKEPFITNLLKYIEKIVDELEINYRLYPDIRVEKSFSKLFLYLMGIYQPKEIDKNSLLEERIKKKELDVPFVNAYQQIELEKDKIIKIMGTNSRAANRYFKMEEFHKLFYFQLTTDDTVKISCKYNKNVLKQIERANKVLASNVTQAPIKLRLIEPYLVQDGERNLAIVNWAIAYKWNGYSESETLEKIKLRIRQISNVESSRACKETQIKATVHSIFSNRKELFGIKKIILPNWLEDDKFFLNALNSSAKSNSLYWANAAVNCLKMRPIIPSRSIAPLGEYDYRTVPSCSNRFVTIKEEKMKRTNLISLDSFKKKKKTKILQGLTKASKIYAVSYNQRIGFFVEGNLILCLIKNRHYKLSQVLSALSQLIKRKILNSDIVHMRRNTKLYVSLARILYNENVFAIQSQQICGNRRSKTENMNVYFQKRAKALGITLEQYLESVPKSQQQSQNEDKDFDFEIPF